MNNEMLSVISGILSDYGSGVFENTQRVNAVLLDLAPNMPRERILVRSFVEADGFRLLTQAGDTLPVVINRLVQTLADMFCMEREAAAWVTHMCAAALGLSAEFDAGAYSEKKFSAVHDGGSSVALGMGHMAAAAADGTVFSHGRNDYFQCDVSGWRNVVSVAAGIMHTAGLTQYGTVLAIGLNDYDQCDVGEWDSISALYAFGYETVGVRSDGKVLSAGRGKLNLEHFENIKSIAKAPLGIYGINGEGKVLYSDLQADEDTLNELEWLNSLPSPGVAGIISRASDCVALCGDGRIYKYGESPGYFSAWRDILSMVDLGDCFAVLRKDGSVRVLPFNRKQPRAVLPSDAWKDIAAIYGNYQRLIGQSTDGRLLAVYTGMTNNKEFGNFEFLQDWYPIFS